MIVWPIPKKGVPSPQERQGARYSRPPPGGQEACWISTAPEDGCDKNDDDSEDNFDQGGIDEDDVDEEF